MRASFLLSFALVLASGCDDIDRDADPRCACEVPAPLTQFEPLDEYDGEQWSVVVQPSDDQPALEAGLAWMWVPAGVEQLDGILVFSHHALGAEMFDDARWRAAAVKGRYALMEVDILDTNDPNRALAVPEQTAVMLEALIEAMAVETDRPDVATAPLVTWGHSAGSQLTTAIAAMMPDRMAAFIGFHGSVKNWQLEEDGEMFARLMAPEFLDVPGLLMVAQTDPTGLRDTTVAMLEAGHSRGAHWAVTVDADQDHWGTEGTFELMVPFVAAAFAPSSHEGWFGTLDHFHESTGDNTGIELVADVSIAPVSTGVDDHWLPTEAFADRWLAYHQRLP
jgi:pimeloyl-ACP methyl ester carboxylesterase